MVQKEIATRKTGSRLKNLWLVLYYLLESIVLFFVPMSLRKQKDVSNKIILITGAGSGIGQLTALKFLKLGAKIVIWDVNVDGMETTKAMAMEEKLNVQNLHLYKIDITNRNSVYETAKKVKEEVGIVDILINNAGVVSGKNLLDIPDDRIDLTFRVNSISHFYMLKAFLPDMIKRKSGHIVTVASVAGNIGVCSLSDYCASKYANVGMDMALRVELAKAHMEQIKTTIVKPYFITTGMFAGVDPGFLPYLKPEYVTEKIVLGVLTETVQVVIPWYLDWLLAIIQMLPINCVIPLYDFFNGYEFMENFHGRTEEMINNNSIKN